MDALQIGLIFPALAILVWLAAEVLCVAEVIPGSPRPLAPWLLIVSGCLALALIFALLFHDYGTGTLCLSGHDAPGGGARARASRFSATWLLLSRGFAVNLACRRTGEGISRRIGRRWDARAALSELRGAPLWYGMSPCCRSAPRRECWLRGYSTRRPVKSLVMKDAATGPQPTSRVLSVDALRGLVMIIMALDHTRVFFIPAP